jgi:hypothetical protein
MAHFDGSLSQIDVSSSDRMAAMTRRWPGVVAAVLLVGAVVPAPVVARVSAPGEQAPDGPYARIAILRPHDGDTVDFESGYVRHLEWHRQARDSWVWYGWNVTFGERQRWFVYASFGHSAASLDNPVPAAEDERDNILNVTPHAQFVGNALYEYLPALSRGTGQPQPTARLELTTVDLNPGATRAFEAAVRARQSTLRDETLWYRMVAGGPVPRYVRLRPRPSLSAVLRDSSDQALADDAIHSIARTTVEILTLRPTMSLGLESAGRK